MKTQSTAMGGSRRKNTKLLALSAALIALTLLVIPFFSSSSASSSRRNPQELTLGFISNQQMTLESYILSEFGIGASSKIAIFDETIETFAADCTTAKSTFILGETVCARTDGVDLNFPGGRWVNWILAPATVVSGGPGSTLITTNPQTFTFTPTQTGSYKASIAETGDISQTPAGFTVVQEPPIATYRAGCTISQSSFSLGDSVCVKVSGASVDPDRILRRIHFVNASDLLVGSADVTSSSQTQTFTLPATATSVIDGNTVDNRGTWHANLVDTEDGSVSANALLSVHDPAEQVSDVSISKVRLNSFQAFAGNTIQSVIWAFNKGPDAAQNVQFLDVPPANTTFQSLTQTSGPTFNCTTPSPGSPGSSTCTIATLNAGQGAGFLVNYLVDGNVGTGETTDTVSVTTDTTDRTATDNNYSETSIFANPNPPTCTITCPDNITVGRNAAGGATVNFPEAETAGTSCGTGITSVPTSGSFFPVGSTIVTQTTGSGQSCTFTVTVVDVAQPTISCPPDKTQSASSGQTEASVDTGTPTFTGSLAELSSSRSDQRDVSEPYPIGTTFITWTVTDQYATTASCIQKVTVTSADAPTISCPSNKSFTASSGCTFTATAAQIGTPSTTGPNVTVTNERSDALALTDPYPAGQTAITWTATNSVGTTSCTQIITVLANDTVAPTLNVPPGVSVTTSTCSALLDDELGVATADDNCSPSVNITRTGVPRVACPIAGDPLRTCESFVFPTGTTVITYTATDAAGNTATGTQTVTVTEDPAVPPTITAPADVTLFTGPGAISCGVNVSNLDATLGTATASDNCPGVIITRVGVPAGNNFPVGNTTITYRGTDRSGNFAEDTQVVTVIDNTPPTISCPAPITLEPTCPSGAIATWNPPVGTDNCPGATTTRTAGPAPGSVFPIGTTTVTYAVTDAHGNSASCSFTVTVLTPQAVVQNLIAAVNASSLTGPQKNGLLSKLNAALSAINNGQTNIACPKLSDFVNSVGNLISHGDLSAAQGNAWISSANKVRNTIGCTNLPCS